MAALRVLYVATECAPWLKVGGLADVAAALPPALAALGLEVRVLLPRIEGLPAGEPCGRLGADASLRALDGPGGVPLWLLDTPRLRRRRGIYADGDGRAYADDAEAFAELCRAAAAIALGRADLGWRPDLVHCNEWQTALVPLYLLLARAPAASVLTVHNLAHQGLFPLAVGARLGLPSWALQPAAAEFWGGLSFLKAGLVFADRLTTVSPRYAEEILTPAFGAGLDGVLRERADALDGILNGLDTATWNPADDARIAAPYDAARPAGKRLAKQALLRELGWHDADAPLAAVIARLTPQKGVDLVLDALPDLLALGLRVVVLGRGEAALEERWRTAAQAQPERVAVHLTFDEALAHRLYAGSDLFLMPSRFEPCGLAQMSALRYGAIPVVNPVGGLADTVVDAEVQGLPAAAGNGFRLRTPDAAGLREACARAVARYADAPAWQALVERALRCRFDWGESAQRYCAVYRAALAARARAVAFDADSAHAEAAMP